MSKPTWLIVAFTLVVCVVASQRSAGQTESTSLFVTVTDGAGRIVTGLESKHFEVVADGVRQTIASFSEADEPMSLGIAIQTSGNLKESLDGIRDALRQFTEASHAFNEIFLVSHASLPEAIGQAQAKLSQSRKARRVLLVLADAPAQTSLAAGADWRASLWQNDVQLFYVGLSETAAEPKAAWQELTQAAGGTAFFPDSTSELANALSRIALELQHQYRLGLTSLPANLQVRLNPPRGLPALSLRVTHIGR
ncbi:MAG: hypothetical protein SF097_11885 [Acidobacteriota bacterium]|nr:hypothetical protein [Acidobacteriota bacterium]